VQAMPVAPGALAASEAALPTGALRQRTTAVVPCVAGGALPAAV
jgi:hypothetical protein